MSDGKWRCVLSISLPSAAQSTIKSTLRCLNFGPSALFPPLMLSALPAHVYVQRLPAQSTGMNFSPTVLQTHTASGVQEQRRGRQILPISLPVPGTGWCYHRLFIG